MTWEGKSLGQLLPLTDDLEFLQREGIFRATSPNQLTLRRGECGWNEAQQLREDLTAIITTERHRAQRSNEYVHIHRGKTDNFILNDLQSEGLIKPAESTPYREKPGTRCL
jgi:hypothetical protein